MSITITILFFLIFLAASVHIWRSPGSRKRKLTLIFIRFLLFAAIVAALFQPSFQIKSLASLDNKILLLIDASKSMNLFNHHKAVDAIKTIQQKKHSNGTAQSPEFVYYLFGDSLRRISSLEDITFNDNRTDFPVHVTDTKFNRFRSVLILSDGNWTNDQRTSRILLNKESRYISLEQNRTPPFITVYTPQSLYSTAIDAQAAPNCLVSGYSDIQSKITITCRSDKKQIGIQQIEIDSGFFEETVRIPITPKSVGTYLYEIKASLQDTVHSSSYMVHTVYQNSFTALLHASRPLLDKRFLTLALREKTNWTVRSSKIQSPTPQPDVCFFFDQDTEAQELIRLFPHSTLVFIGCTPCRSPETVDTSTDNKYSLSLQGSRFFDPVMLDNVPPLPVHVACPDQSYSANIVYLYRTAKKDEQENKHPLLYERRFENKQSLVFAAKELWRWDFWPHGMYKNQSTNPFMDSLLVIVETMIHYNKNQDFYAFPDISPIYETDSLSFKIAFPPAIDKSAPVPVHVSIVSLQNDTMYNQNISIPPLQTHRYSFRCPPLPRGTYSYTFNVNDTHHGTFTYSDSLQVYAQNAELRVNGQNRILLDQIATALPMSDSVQLQTFLTSFAEKNHNALETITRTFSINRSWYLLCALFTLLGIEWLIRRIWKFD